MRARLGGVRWHVRSAVCASISIEGATCAVVLVTKSQKSFGICDVRDVRVENSTLRRDVRGVRA